MRKPGPAVLLVFLVAATTACATGTSPGEPPSSTQALSADASSAASVRLEWPLVDGAESYLVEGRYGEGEYFTIADLPAERDSFTHFLVPGSTEIDYRLSARSGAELDELETVSVSLPQSSPNPLLAEPQAFAPTVAGLPGFPTLPTMDPTNPDLSAMATAMSALATSVVDNQSPQVLPVGAEQVVGPEGGTATVTDPNGVVYTLELPPGAVTQSTTITLTPIESFSGFPFASGSLGAVQIYPPIPFAGPMSLTIALPSDQDPAESDPPIGFAVSSFNHELSMAPVYPSGDRGYHMNIYRGDTFGLATASLDEVAAQAARIPTDPREQMAQQLAALLAFNPDRSPEGELLIGAQVLQGLLGQIQSITAQTIPGGGARLAASAPLGRKAPDLQYRSAAQLMTAILFSEPVWDFLNQMVPPGAPIPGGNELASSMAALRERIVSELTAAVKAYMDEHDGCRTGLALYAEALRQLLRSPGTPFRQALATNYRARYGPPPDLQCEFRLQIIRSSIKEEIPGNDPLLGDSIRTYAVHSEPWLLELDVQVGRLFLRGPVGTVYDAWEWTFTNCPPTAQLRPFPTSLIWITDLGMEFDSDDHLSDLVLQGVTPDRLGGSGDGRGETDTPEAFKCRLVKVSVGSNPVDAWGLAFSSLHGRARNMDNWVITGEDSFVATDTILGRVEGGSLGQYTEDTTIVLTVNQK